VKTARGLHDEISKELSEIGNGIDAFAGRVDCSTEHRAFLRHLSSKISSLSELLNAEIPGLDATSRTVFSVEIRSEISEINQMLEVEDAQEEILLKLRELLSFPKNFGVGQRSIHRSARRSRHVRAIRDGTHGRLANIANRL